MTNLFSFNFYVILSAVIGFLLPAGLFTQVKTVTEGNYTYTIVENDPTKTRMYKLDNGLTVYLTVYKNQPRIQTYIPVKTGSKMDILLPVLTGI